jgi:hypothetical protein
MELERFNLEIVKEGIPALVCSMTAQPELLERIKATQINDPECLRIMKQLEEGKALGFCLRDDGMLTHFKQVCVPASNELRKEIKNKAHHSLLFVHPGSTKMYKDVKSLYWYNNMKKNNAKFVEQCSTC